MKINRSVKCYFSKWLTDKKLRSLRRFLSEYHRVVSESIKLNESNVLQGESKLTLLLAENLCKVDSWLTARAKKNAFAEGIALIKGTQESVKALKANYKTPTHRLGRAMLSETNASIIEQTELKEFDLLVKLGSFDGLKTKKLPILLKKNRLLNQYILNQWKLCKSVLITERYVQFTFEMDVKKKVDGDIIGIDPGAINLLTTTEGGGTHYGTGIMSLLHKLRLKKRCSKAWYRCRAEIRQYIDRTCKSLKWSELKHVVLEDNRKIKNKMKFKGRLNKNMRSLLTGWAIGRINERMEMLCEANGVRLARVPAWNNSRTCPDCGFCHQENRKTQDEFICVECGSFHNADFVGSVNSLARFALGPYGAECKQLFTAKFPFYRMHNFA